MKILDFGSCNVDYVYDVEHIVQPGETLIAENLSLFPGGKGLNQAIAIAKAGADVFFAGCISKDDSMLRPILKQAGVDMTHLLPVAAPTGQAIIQVDKQGENSIVIYHGANGAVAKKHIDSVLGHFDAGDILLLQNEISNLLYLVETAARKGMRIILNPSPFEEKLKEIDLNDLYCVILNETEAMQWTGTTHPYDFLLWAQKEYPGLCVVLTLGKKGSILLKDGTLYRQQSFKVSAVDTTAAGDTFTGYFVAGLSRHDELPGLCRVASAASAIAVSRKGAASSIPIRSEVDDMIDLLPMNALDNQKEQRELVMSFLAAHVADIKLSDIAGILGYHEDHTGKWLQKQFGMSFSELLQQERCRIAAGHLKNTDLSIEEIIQRIGYTNGSFFRKLFDKYYHVSPKEYRKQFRL